jgi:hypothetical protein
MKLSLYYLSAVVIMGLAFSSVGGASLPAENNLKRQRVDVLLVNLVTEVNQDVKRAIMLMPYMDSLRDQATVMEFQSAAYRFSAAARASHDLAQQREFYGRASLYASEVIKLKKNQTTAEDYAFSSYLCYQAGFHSMERSEKYKCYLQAAKDSDTLLTLKKEQATAIDYYDAARYAHEWGVCAFNAAEQLEGYRLASLHMDRSIELKGAQATVEELGLGVKYVRKVALLSEAPKEIAECSELACIYMDKLLELKDEPTMADLELAMKCYHDGGEIMEGADKTKYFSSAAICGLQFIETHENHSYEDYYLASLCLAKACKYTKDLSLKGVCLYRASKYADRMIELYHQLRAADKSEASEDELAVNMVRHLKKKK